MYLSALGQVDLPGVLSVNPLPLSQGVLLSLLQQLACDISKETPRKLMWMREVLTAINPTDPMIAMHVRPIFEQVYQILNHQRNLPTMVGAELANIRLIMHVINSMLMSSKWLMWFVVAIRVWELKSFAFFRMVGTLLAAAAAAVCVNFSYAVLVSFSICNFVICTLSRCNSVSGCDSLQFVCYI